MKTVHVMLATIVLVFSGCLLEPEETVSQGKVDIESFSVLWEEYERNYPLFIEKNINWVEVAREYYPMALEVETIDELALLVLDMLAILEDPAIYVELPGGERVYSFEKEYESNVDIDVLMDNYLIPNGYAGYVGGFGWCDPSILPYAFFDTFPGSSDGMAAHAFDQFIGECVSNEVSGIILDIRMNPLGHRVDYRYDHYVMSRFLEHMHIGAVYRYRIGPEYSMLSDYHPAIYPAGPNRYYGPVYLLIGGECILGSEDMAANMAYFPNCTVVGDTTGGTCFTGWKLHLSEDPTTWGAFSVRGTLLTHDFKYIEGNGVPPGIVVESTEADFAAGIDPVLEYAMGLLD